MERRELHKLIHNNFDSYAKDHGYSYQINKSSLFWYSIENDIIRSIGFETKSDGYCPVYLIQPLYMGHEYVVLSYGRDISHCKHKKYYLDINASHEELTRNIEYTKKHLNIKVNNTLKKLCNPKILTNDFNKRHFLCSPYNMCELKAYSNLYIGKYDKAFKLFSKMLPQASSLNSSVVEKAKEILDMIENNKEKIPDYLQKNINITMSALKLVY